MRRMGRWPRIAAVVGAGALGYRLLSGLRQSDLTGEVALVTGSSRGFGYLLARAFGRQGCRVVICARDAGELERARAALSGEGIETLAIPCDVSDQAQVEAMVQQATAHFGRVDIVVNNAGIIQVGPLETLTTQDFENSLGVMYWGTVYSTLAVLPQMRRRRAGRIVNITSIGARISVPHLLPYNAAKFAAAGFSEGLRAELADDGISVTTILPGLMRTGSYVNALFSGQQQYEAAWFSIASSVPLMTMDAERAADQVVRATRRGEAERILGLPFSVVVRLKGLAPGLTADILGLVDSYLLPKAGGAGPELVRGETALERLDSPLVRFLTTLGRRAGQHYHEEPGPDIAPGADEARQPAGESP